MGSPVGQADPLQRAALVGSSCLLTPDHQSSAGQRPETPDTANLLQRALASSGSAVFNSLSLPKRTEQQQQPGSTENAVGDSLGCSSRTDQQQPSFKAGAVAISLGNSSQVEQQQQSNKQPSCMEGRHQSATGQPDLNAEQLSVNQGQHQMKQQNSIRQQPPVPLRHAAANRLHASAQQPEQLFSQSSAVQQPDKMGLQDATEPSSISESLVQQSGPASDALQPAFVSAQVCHN